MKKDKHIDTEGTEKNIFLRAFVKSLCLCVNLFSVLPFFRVSVAIFCFLFITPNITHAYKSLQRCPSDMVYIPPGEFTLGCSPGDTECGADENPPVQTRMKRGFCLDKTEVTQTEYKRIMGTNPSKRTFCCNYCPVETVTWKNAKDFCRKMNKRLPTEAEWEYAARAGSEARYFWGDKPDGRFAWYHDNSQLRIHPVAKTKPNKFDLYDMLGNVWEWVRDCYDKDWYGRAKPGGDLLNTKPECGAHASRGGSWFSYTLSVSRRKPEYHNDAEQGFRCAKDTWRE